MSKHKPVTPEPKSDKQDTPVLSDEEISEVKDTGGLKKALEKAGVKPGDRIRCGNLEWEW